MKRISLLTATCIVIANMVGTGIFTSLGFQVGGLPTGFSIIALWIVGGICALCGAVSYAELGAALPRSGGEYNFLGVAYHPAVGFLAGWISMTVGFAAPVAIAAKPFGTYLADIWPAVNPMVLSLAVVWISTLILLRDVKIGSAFQDGSTILKIVLVLVIIGAVLWVKSPQPIHFLPSAGDGGLITSAPFAISLYYVMYSYSGWNASTYIVGEMDRPARNIPLSVGLGTVIVMVLYVAVNAVFLYSTPIAEMAGKEQVALVAGRHLFGETGGNIMALFICLGLVSTVSSMMWIGPRVTMTMGQDLHALRWLGRQTAHGLPLNATLTQAVIATVLLTTASFDTVLKYVQFSLTLSSALAVAGVIVLRFRQPSLPRPYRAWGYPVTPVIFLGVSAWMMWFMLKDKSTRDPSLLGLVTIVLGLVVYYLSPKNPSPAPAAATA